MAISSSLNLVREVTQKQNDGTFGEHYRIGATFNDIVDGERSGASGYSLADFFDNYMSFMNNSFFVYRGTNEPTNTHIGIWIDTGHKQNDF